MRAGIAIAQFGLGPIGLETLKLAATKPWARIVGGIDVDPAKVGRDLGDLTSTPKLRGCKVYPTLEALVSHQRPDLVFHTAVSKFEAAFVQLQPMVRRGIHVVSSCEELVFPRLRHGKLAERLDRLCRKSGARVVGTGVNPGFAMDLLPLCLTGVSRTVRSIHVQRVVNASTRREPLQRKIGSGLAPEEFRRRFRARRIGHAGLAESLALIAHGLGWKIESLVESGAPIITKHRIRTRYLEVLKGQTCGLHQRAKAVVDGQTRLALDLRMYLDANNPHDAIQIKGDPPLDLVVRDGIAGDQATAGALVNTARNLYHAAPGLRLLTELPLPRLA